MLETGRFICIFSMVPVGSPLRTRLTCGTNFLRSFKRLWWFAGEKGKCVGLDVNGIFAHGKITFGRRKMTADVEHDSSS